MFWNFWRWKIWYFWAKKLMEIWYLLITEKFLLKPFRKWEIWSFLEPKSWRKYDIYWLLKSSCFNLFGNGKYGLFLSQKVDGNMIFTDYWKVLVLKFYYILKIWPNNTRGISWNSLIKHTCSWCDKSIIIYIYNVYILYIHIKYMYVICQTLLKIKHKVIKWYG